MIMYSIKSLLLPILSALTTASPISSPSDGVVVTTVSQTSSARVDLGYATYQGTALPIGVNSYLGMRFAAPPVGDLRWRAPEDPLSEDGVQSATKFEPVCLGISVDYSSTSQREDCLFINVWTPSTAGPDSKLAVWVFIQGGGYVTDYNNNYNGTNVVNKSGNKIVFVNFNYRVSAWGFLASEKVRENGTLNAGIMDQRKALEWVQKYISLFGGDPEAVVIHGVSAGAGSVSHHLTAYGGRDDGLFRGAIGESVFWPTSPRVSSLEFQFESFASLAGCGNATDELACLRAQDTAILQAANVPIPYPGTVEAANFPWTPTVDGDLIQDSSYNLYNAGKFIHVPIIFGNDNDEGTAFAANAASAAAVSTFMHNNFPLLSSSDLDAINSLYPPNLTDTLHNAYFHSAEMAYGESVFICPAISIAQAYVKYVSSYEVWQYRVNIIDNSSIDAGYGVTHTMEIPAIFGPGFAGSSGTFVTYNANIVPIVMDYWISFVRELTPNRYKNEAAPHWEAYTKAQRRVKFQTNATAMEDVPTEQLARCEFWKGLGSVTEG